MSIGERPSTLLFAARESSAPVPCGLYDVLQSAGAGFGEMISGSAGDEMLDIRFVSFDGTPFRCIGNIPGEPHTAIHQNDSADTVIVCGMHTSIYDAPRGRQPRGCVARHRGIWYYSDP